MMAKEEQATEASEQHLPLSGVKVLDLTLARAGPTCVRHLADWGAEITRIEPPDDGSSEDLTGRRAGFDFQNLHRNKRMVSLNLKKPAGLAAFMKLVKGADVIIENMRAAVKHRLGVSYDDVRKINPRIVYGSISGFGQTGPYGKRAGVDQIVQGMGGLMSITGLPGQGPVRVGLPIADLTAGNLLALGVMMALFDRTRTGVGRWCIRVCSNRKYSCWTSRRRAGSSKRKWRVRRATIIRRAYPRAFSRRATDISISPLLQDACGCGCAMRSANRNGKKKRNGIRAQSAAPIARPSMPR